MPIEIRVAKNIRRYRLMQKMTQRELAEAMTAMGATIWAQPQISDIEQGRTQLKLSTLERLANCLKCTVVELIAIPPTKDRKATVLTLN